MSCPFCISRRLNFSVLVIVLSKHRSPPSHKFLLWTQCHFHALRGIHYLVVSSLYVIVITCSIIIRLNCGRQVPYQARRFVFYFHPELDTIDKVDRSAQPTQDYFQVLQSMRSTIVPFQIPNTQIRVHMMPTTFPFYFRNSVVPNLIYACFQACGTANCSKNARGLRADMITVNIKMSYRLNCLSCR